MANLVNPGASGSVNNFPNTTEVIAIEGMDGFDTRYPRTQIDDNKCSWLENLQPIGKSTLVPTPTTTSGAFAGNGNYLATFDFVSIGQPGSVRSFLVEIMTDGSAYAMDMAGVNVPLYYQIAPSGTILGPNQNTCGIGQAGNQYAVLVSTIGNGMSGTIYGNGYYLWDGNALFHATTLGPTVIIDNPGSQYGSPPNCIPYGGGGGGAVLNATIGDGAVTSIAVSGPGSGYNPFDEVIIAFRGGNNGGAYTAIGIPQWGLQGEIDSILITDPGMGYTSTTAARIIGGGGGGCELSVEVAFGAISSITVLTPGVYPSQPTLDIYDPNSSVAHATVQPMPYGIFGSATCNYLGFQWVVNGSVVEFSAPSAPGNFNPGAGAGAFRSTDPFLRYSYKGVRQAQGFLFLLGDNSINYISNAVSSGSNTTFSNLNVEPTIGLSWPNAVCTFESGIVFANVNGVYAVTGNTVKKISADLDGIWPTSDVLSGFIPSMAVTYMNGVQVFCLLIYILDPITGSRTQKILCSDGSRWWSITPPRFLVQIGTFDANSVRTVYGCDGYVMYQLFVGTDSSVTRTIQSKLYEGETGYWYTHVARRLYGKIKVKSLTAPTINMQLDCDSGATTPTYTYTPTAIGNQVIGPYSVAPKGAQLGLTVTTNSPDTIFMSFVLVGQAFSANV